MDDDPQLSPPSDAAAVHRIAPAGELDVASIDPVRDDVDTAIAQGATAIVFDLTEVTFLDSSALAVFAYAARRVTVVQVSNPSALARRVLEETGLLDVLHVTP